MSSNRPPIPVRAGRIGLRRHGDNYLVWVPESEICMIADYGPDRGPAVRLREDPTRLTPIDATTEEILEACELARAGDAAAKIIADLREEVRVLQNALDEEHKQNEDLSRWLRDAQQRANELDKQVNNRQNVIDDLREQIAEELNQEPPARQRSTPP